MVRAEGSQLNTPALHPDELEAIRSVFRRHPEVTMVKLFGSRAKGTQRPESDVDLAIWGDVDALAAEAIATELDELPLPYRYDVIASSSIHVQALREHIARVGVQIFPAP
jgi:predicted nucleotidyltransferase